MIYACFDLESTGLDPNYHEAIELSAVLMKEGTLCPTTENFCIKMHIEKPERITAGTLGVHNHYDKEKWDAEGVSQLEGWTRLCDWLFKISDGGANRVTLVGQNITGFDYPMLKHWTTHFRLSPQITYHPEDLIHLYHYILKRYKAPMRRYNLKVISEFFGVTNPQAHSSLDDAYTTAVCYALGEAYADAMVDCGRYDHNALLMEAWHRIGFPRTKDYQPLPKR